MKKLLTLILLASAFCWMGCKVDNKATNGNKLVAVYEKVHKDFDEYLLIGNAYLKSGNRDSAMYYGGKINATYRILEDIGNQIKKQ